jgi:hypothetical protein
MSVSPNTPCQYPFRVATLNRVRVAWTTGIGGPGLSTFYLPAASTDVSGINTFFTAMKPFFLSSVTWQVPNSGDQINDATGALTGAWSGSGGTTQIGTGTGAYAAGTGGFVIWNTSTIVGKRRLKGRTFLCPLSVASYEGNGTLLDATRASIENAANALAPTTPLQVWHRPTTPGGSNGTSAAVVNAQVKDQVTSLRSRRS